MKNLLINRVLAAKKKKIFTLLLALVASVGTMFAEKVQIGDLYYNINAVYYTAEVIYKSYNYSNYEYNEGWGITTANIPDPVTYNSEWYFVKRIGDNAFNGCTGLTSITIPNSVTSIGNKAFFKCSSLTSITIPNSVKSIGEHAFRYCTGLTSVTIGKSVTSIGDYAFYECSKLTSITIPNSVTSIGERAFQYCSSLTSVTIPNSVTSIGDYAFDGCSSLTAIDVATDNPNYCSEGGVLFNKDKTTLIRCPRGKQGAYTIPNNVTSIGEGAFNGCTGLTSITIPNSVTYIGEGAFNGCTGLTSVTIPNSVTSIGTGAFYRCSSLTSVTIEAETPPTCGNNVLYSTNACPIYVPCNAVNAYKTEWSPYADRIRRNGNCTSSYTIKFKNWDGSVLQSTQVEEGKMPQYTGTTPTRPDDSQYTYTFSGWTPQIVAATADASYTATYTDTPRNQGVEDVLSDQVQCTKVIRDGQVLILRNGKTYTMQGQEVK